MRRLPLAPLLLAIAVAVGAACYQDPEQQIAEQQMLTDMSDAINQMGLQIAELTAVVDSMRMVIAKHDTAVYRMANVTGVPYTR